MTLRHFEIFSTVCETLNMTNAAKKIYMSQPAVSQSIHELEEYYGVTVFERLGKRLYITPSGERLLEYARRILGLYDDAGREMEAVNKNMPFRIGVSVTIGAGILPGLADKARAITPPLILNVVENNTREIQRLLLESRLDLALVEGKITVNDLIQIHFYNDSMALMCGESHPYYNMSIVEPHELESQRFLLREEGSGTRETFETAMKLRGLSWTTAWVCSNVDTIKAAVIQGLGVTVLSPLAAKSELESGRLKIIPVNDMSFEREFKLVYHKNKLLTRAMQKFIELVHLQFAQP